MSRPLRAPRVATWGLFAVVGLLAVVGTAPAVTLVVALGAVTTALATVGSTLVAPKRARRVPSAGTTGQVDPPPTVVIPPQPLLNDLRLESPVPRPVETAEPPGPEDLAGLSDPDLCHAWQTSYLRLKRMHRLCYPQQAIVDLTLTRARYLNELERRHPDGFSAWIASEPRGPSDPTSYLGLPGPSSRRPRRP